MQRASAAFGLLIFALWLAVLAVGLAYVTVWAATQRRPQWRVLELLKPDARGSGAEPPRHLKRPATIVGLERRRPPEGESRHPENQPSVSAKVIPFDREAAQRRRRRAAG